MPIDQLFNDAGLTPHIRGEYLGPEAIEAVLRSSRDIRLVEAHIGVPLRWYRRGDYGFWYHCARQHAAEPDGGCSLDDFPDSRCYFVSMWRSPNGGEQVLLFEVHH